MGYVKQKPVYGQKCVAWEREVVGWEIDDGEDFELRGLSDFEPLSFSDFDRDAMLPPEGWSWDGPPGVLQPPPDLAPPSEVPISPAWAIFAIGALGLVLALRRRRT